MAEDINEKKKEIYLENQKNMKILRILKMIVYILVGLLFIDMMSYFIIGIMLEKSNFFFNNLALPIAIILFGVIAILLTKINPRVSKSNNLKGDNLVFIFGIILTILGIVYFIIALV